MRPAAAFLIALTVALGCGGESAERPEADPTPTPTVPVTPPAGPNEFGDPPVFWRTLDRFCSLRAGEPYLVVLRVVNGYDAATLPIAARPAVEGEQVDFVAERADPTGTDAPGAYYIFNLLLPDPGEWELTVKAGADDVALQVTAQ